MKKELVLKVSAKGDTGAGKTQALNEIVNCLKRNFDIADTSFNDGTGLKEKMKITLRLKNAKI